MQRSGFRRPHDRQHHPQHAAAGTIARISQEIARQGADHAGASNDRERRLRLCVELSDATWMKCYRLFAIPGEASGACNSLARNSCMESNVVIIPVEAHLLTLTISTFAPRGFFRDLAGRPSERSR